MTDAVPEKLGKYKIIEEVGRGGFAAVYKALDTTLDRTVALKVLASHLLWDPTFVQRFQREAKVAANLNHPNIVTIYEVSQIEGVYFIAMRFLEGRTLSQVLEAEGPWPISGVQAIIEQLASALDYAHARGFVHRDIKPSNIIVAEDGRVTLTDFGLVKAGEGTQLTATGTVFGTPEYMSPEQAEGQELDARSDIYSLGVVLFAMLVGRAPFVADTTMAVMYKHVHDPPPLGELPYGLPQSVVAVVEKALAKKREERYQSVGEMAAALQQGVSGAVVEEVKAPPELALHLSLTLQLSVKPRTVEAGGEAKWTVTLRNDGDDDLRHVTVRRGRSLLEEPFDLAAGKGRRFTFTTTYEKEGKKSERVTAIGIASTGGSVHGEAKATVQVTPIPPEVPAPPPVEKKPVAEEVVAPSVEPAAVAKEKLKPPTVPPEPEKPAPVSVPPSEVTTPPRPKRIVFLPLLMIAIGWAVAWAIAWAIGVDASKTTDLVISCAIGGAISGLITGLALRRTESPILWKWVLMVVLGWAIGGAITGAILWGIISPMKPTEEEAWPIALCCIGWPIVWTIGGAIGGLITGLALRQAEPSIPWKQVLIVAVGWAIGEVIGAILWGIVLAIVLVIGEATTLTIGEATSSAIAGAIFGVIAGAIGAGMMFWQLSRVRRRV